MSNTGTGFVVCVLGLFQDQTEESPEQPGLIAEADSILTRRLDKKPSEMPPDLIIR